MFSKVRKRGEAETGPSGRKGPTIPSLLGTDMTLTGDLVSEGEIQIDGTVDGDVRCARLVVGEVGCIRGQILAEAVLVRGKVDGQIEARAVTLARSARVVGDIVHETLTIEPGAHLEGRCEHRDDVSRPRETHLNVVVSDGAPTGA